MKALRHLNFYYVSGTLNTREMNHKEEGRKGGGGRGGGRATIPCYIILFLVYFLSSKAKTT